MVIFHSYVKLPEGNYLYIPIWVRYSHPPWCEKCLDFPVVPMDRQIWSGTLAVVSLSLSERLVAVSAPIQDSLIQSFVLNMNHGSTSPWWFVYGEPSDHKPMRFNMVQWGSTWSLFGFFDHRVPFSPLGNEHISYWIAISGLYTPF